MNKKELFKALGEITLLIAVGCGTAATINAFVGYHFETQFIILTVFFAFLAFEIHSHSVHKAPKVEV